MNLIEIAKNYFAEFSKKNLNSLSDMFTDDVILIDWEINQSGKNNVLNANKKIFDSVDTISVKPLILAQNDNTVFAELLIKVNDTITLKVVDVITFNPEGNIEKIVAYKR